MMMMKMEMMAEWWTWATIVSQERIVLVSVAAADASVEMKMLTRKGVEDLGRASLHVRWIEIGMVTFYGTWWIVDNRVQWRLLDNSCYRYSCSWRSMMFVPIVPPVFCYCHHHHHAQMGGVYSNGGKLAHALGAIEANKYHSRAPL